MEPLTLHQADTEQPLNVLQITDTHLFADGEKALLGVPTLASFRAVLQQIKADNMPVDLIVATGDISQDDSAQSYLTFAREISTLGVPCVWLPGNHDDLAVMSACLHNPQLSSAKHIMSEHWQIIMLNSQLNGFAKGYLTAAELDKLKATLDANPTKNTLICVHHHLLAVGSAWLDQHILENGEELITLIADYPNVKAVIWGHVHQDCEFTRNGQLLLATPSTCVQFKPQSDDFAIDALPPGYRYIQLHADGRFVHQLRRIQSSDFKADSQAQGY